MDDQDAVTAQAGEAPTEAPTELPLLTCIPVGALAANCYIVACQRTREALVIDPGAEADVVLAAVAALGVSVVGIVHTHGHFDHISATEDVLAGLPGPVPVVAHPADAYLYQHEARAMGVAFEYPLPEPLITPSLTLVDEGEVAVGDLRLRVIHTPGHTPGSVSLVYAGRFVLSGDTLFRRGIGRTDLPGGDEDQIYESITQRLYTLPDELAVYPGHGPATTIGEERRGNPYARG